MAQQSPEPSCTATSCYLKLFYGKFKILFKTWIIFVTRHKFQLSKLSKKARIGKYKVNPQRKVD